MRGPDFYIGAVEKAPQGEMSSLISTCGGFFKALLSDRAFPSFNLVNPVNPV